MKKIRGFADPITLGFILITLGTALAANETAKIEANHNKTVKAQVVTPHSQPTANTNTVASSK